MAESRIEFDILARDRASSEFSQVGQAARDLEGDLARSGQNAGDGFASGIESGLDSAKGGILAAAAGIATEVGALAAANISHAVEAEAVSDSIGAQLALPPAQVEAAGEVAGRIYGQGFGESLEQVEQAAVGVAQNLNVAVDDVSFKPLTQDAIAFSQVFGQDVGESVRAVGRLMKTDLVDSGSEGFDTLTALFSQAGTVSDDLLQTLTEYPIQFKSLGLSAQDAAGLMMQGLEGGARDSDAVADSLKELRVRVTDLSAAEGLEKIGLDAEQMASAFAEGGPTARNALDQILTRLGQVSDPAERARVAVELFGTQGENMATAINEIDLSTARDELGTIVGATSAASTQLNDNLDREWTRFSRGLTQVFTDPGEAWHNLTTTEIPGKAVMATETFEGVAGSARNNLGQVQGEMSDTATEAGWMGDALRGLPNHTGVDVDANTSPFWSAIDVIEDTAIRKYVDVAVNSAASALGFPTRAEGGPVRRGDIALVGEEGPEIVQFDGDGQVYPHRESMRMLRQASSPTPLAAGPVQSSGASPARVAVEVDVTGSDEQMVELLRSMIRVRGGDVQSVLGSDGG